MFMIDDILYGIIGSGISGGINSIYNSVAQNQALQNSKELGVYNSVLQHQTALRSGSAMRQAYADMGKSSSFEGSPIQLPSTSSPAANAPSFNMDIGNFMSVLSNLKLQNKEGEKIDSDIEKNDAEINKINAEKDNIVADTNKKSKESENIELDSYSKKILNKYMDDMQIAYIRHLNSDSDRIDNELKINFKKLPYELKYLAAAAYQANQQGNLNNKTIGLISQQIQKVAQETDNLRATWFNIRADYRNKLDEHNINLERLENIRNEGDLLVIEKAIKEMYLKEKLPAEIFNQLIQNIRDLKDAVNPLTMVKDIL